MNECISCGKNTDSLYFDGETLLTLCSMCDECKKGFESGETRDEFVRDVIALRGM